MTFVLPLGLLALLLLPIVALLHLIRQRRQRQRVPSLQLWRDLQRQSVQHQPRRLPLTLLLLLHLLLTALLAIALGQPLMESVRREAIHTAIVLDTSTSMAATDAVPSRIEAARAAARELLAELDRGDSAALIEWSAQPRILAQADGSEAVVLRRALDQIAAGGADGDLQAAINLAQATAQPNAATRIVVLTDRAARAPEQIAAAGEIEWQTVGGEGENVAIVAFAARPLRNGQQQLYARVANLGTEPIARTLQLDLDGQRVANEPMRLAPGAEAEWSWPLPAGTERAEASLSGQDVQPLDDRAAAVLRGNVETRAVLVSATSTPLERALRAQPGFTVERIAPADYRSDIQADLVVFNTYLPPTLPNTSVLVVAPPTDQQLLPVTDQINNVAADEVRDDRFRSIDFRPVQFQSVAQITPPEWASIAVAAEGVPLVLTGQYNNQAIAVWTFDPAASNIANRLAFPLLTAATARALLPQANDHLALGAAAPFALQAADGRSIAVGERLTQPGIYTTGSGALAVNMLDPDESDLRARPQPSLRELPRTVTIDTEPEGRPLWRLLVIAGLVVLIGEWLYSHRGGTQRRARMT